jgi:hypothetical protein
VALKVRLGAGAYRRQELWSILQAVLPGPPSYLRVFVPYTWADATKPCRISSRETGIPKPRPQALNVART